MKRDCVPVWVDPSRRRMPLTRVPRGDRATYDESFLQETLDECPAILPADEFAEDFTPLVSLGREISTDGGPIDNLFISPAGKLTIVETKLWRNPQATREALAQVIDYASSVSRWSYEDLERSCSAKLGGRSLYEYVAASCPDSEVLGERDFHDAVQNSLSTGHFLLLIVGDGIKVGLERMLDYLQSRPLLHFSLGLVELQIFEPPSANGSLLIVPRILVNSLELPRTVFLIEDARGRRQMLVRPEVEATAGSPSKSRRTLSEQEFYDSICDSKDKRVAKELIEGARALGATVQPRAASLMLRLEDPGGTRRLLTLFGVTTDGRIFWGWLPDQLKQIEADPAIGTAWFKSIRQMVPASPKDDAPLAAVEPVLPDFLDALNETIAAIKAAVG